MGEGHFRPEQVGTSHFRAPMNPKTAKKWPFWAVLASLMPIRPFFWLEQGGTHP